MMIAPTIACMQRFILQHLAFHRWPSASPSPYRAATYCRGHCRLAELGEGLGPITVSGPGSARQIMARRLRESRTFVTKSERSRPGLPNQKSKSDD